MKISKHKYQIGIGMIKKGLDYIGFDEKDIIDIIRFVDDKFTK